MIQYQWSFGPEWVTCLPKNNAEFTKRRSNPSLDLLYLTNDFGELWGSFENETMNFRAHGADTEVRVVLRRAPVESEKEIMAVLTQDDTILLDYETSCTLFDGISPKQEKTIVEYSTEKFKAENGHLYQWMNGAYRYRRYKKTDFSRGQLEDMTKTRFEWQFKTPFRDERTRLAINNLSRKLNSTDKVYLRRQYKFFNPSDTDTEYGPFQFTDFLSADNRADLAFQLCDAMAQVRTSDWKPFDAVTNSRIERARANKRPVAMFNAQGETYMIVFDTGNGESGRSAVVIRPSRYQRILESIEEQFNRSTTSEFERHQVRLEEALLEANINPCVFTFALVHGHEHGLDLIADRDIRERITEIMSDMDSSRGDLSTRIQQFMPALLDKFKECDIQMSTQERLDPKPICPLVYATTTSGLSVPASQRNQCANLKDLVKYTQTHQSWILPEGQHTCDICGSANMTTLNHCGNANACLKCWTDSLVQTNMTCPFCRDVISEGQLKKSCTPTLTATSTKAMAKRGRKRKRVAFNTPQQILDEIHIDKRYCGITMDSKEPMRKWFTILLRRKMISISQMPKNEQGRKQFLEAMKAFKLLA